MHLFQPVVGGMHCSRPLAGSSAHAPFPAVGGINNVAAIQPAVGGGAVVAAPAVGGLAPAIGAGGGGGCHPGSSGDGTAVDNPVIRLMTLAKTGKGSLMAWNDGMVDAAWLMRGTQRKTPPEGVLGKYRMARALGRQD